VLVTGGAGFLGHHLVAALLRRGREVTVLDDLSTGRAERLPVAVRFVRGDVRDPAAVAEALEDATEVVHLAAVVSVRGSAEDPVRDADVNVLGTLQILEGLARARADGAPVGRAVLASSMAVYAEGTAGATLREDAPTAPRSPYGVGKLAAEQYWRLGCARAGVGGVVLRYFNAYGPGQTPSPYVGVITHFAERVRAGAPPVIFGDGLQRRDFVHVDDLVAATLAALERDVAGRTLNVGSGRGTTVREVARAVLDALGSPLVPEHAPAREEELREAVADISAARAALGYAPSRTALDLSWLVVPSRGSAPGGSAPGGSAPPGSAPGGSSSTVPPSTGPTAPQSSTTR
jgi:UDP-glucose 4-epimerase